MKRATENRILPDSSCIVFAWLCLVLVITGCNSYSPPPTDTTPPSTPTNLTATVASATQVNLTWAASTDDVGVTGYKVERCQSASCSNFAQISAPTGTTFNDTGLAGSTSYSYRVRATDATGNLSGYSGTASATTTAPTVAVSVLPKRAGITTTQAQQFTPTVTGSSNTSVTWEVDSIANGNSTVGTIDGTGNYTPSATPGVHTVTARSSADTTKTASATIGVTDLAGVFTYHNDNSRTGGNLKEFALTLSNVNTATFGKLFSCTVDAAIYAQPLWVANLTIAGAPHNVVYVATQKNSVYAFDADSATCQILWQKSLNPTGETWVLSADESGCGDLAPNIGIVSTPAIDPSTSTIYLVSKTANMARTVFHQRLHALDLLTGNEKFSGPMDIQASVSGTGGGSSGGILNFDPLINGQRPALLLESDPSGTHVVISWASHCDFGQYHGWVISYNAGTLAREAIFNVSPNGTLGGIWMAGGGPAADTAGNIFFATGNGNWTGTDAFGDSIVKLGPQSGGLFGALDYFTPIDQANLEAGDIDLGSGGLVLLPDVTGPNPHLLVQVGKEGTIYVVNRDNLGQMCTGSCSTGNTQIVQELPGAINGMWGTPAYWNGNLYFGGAQDGASGDNSKAFSVTASAAQPLSFSPASQSANVFTFSGPTPSVSANGTSNGIVWALDNSAFGSSCPAACQVVYAYDATNLATLLYSSSQAAANRDSSGGAVKFTVPTVTNGKVYVGGQTTLTVYGLLPN